MKNMKKLLRTGIKIIISMALICFLFYKIGISQFIENVAEMDKILLIPILVIPIVVRVMEAANFWLLIKAVGKSVGLQKLTKYLFYTWSLGAFAPGKTGQFAMVLFLGKEGVSSGESFMVTLVDKLITVIVLLAVGLFGMHLFFDPVQVAVIYVIVVMILAAVIGLMLIGKCREFIRRYLLRGYSKYFKGFSKSLIHILRREKKLIALNFLITIVKWVISISSIYLIFVALGYPVGFGLTLVIVAISNIVAMIPISLAGLGIKETSGAYLYAQLGYSFVISANALLIFTGIRYLFAIVSMIYFLIKGERFGVKEFLDQ